MHIFLLISYPLYQLSNLTKNYENYLHEQFVEFLVPATPIMLLSVTERVLASKVIISINFNKGGGFQLTISRHILHELFTNFDDYFCFV